MTYVSDYYQRENRALLIIEYGCDWWPQINSFRVATLYIYIYHPYPYADSGWFIYLSIVYSYGCYVWKQGNEKHLEFYIITIEHKLMISHLCKLALVKIRFGTDMHWGIIKSSGNLVSRCIFAFLCQDEIGGFTLQWRHNERYGV